MELKNKSNLRMVELINRLRKENKPLWKRTAELLAKPRRRKVQVNISKISRYGKDGMVVLVPGKVLGDGLLNKKLTIAAYSFSLSARKLIEQGGGKAMTINELLDQKVAPSKVLLVC